MSTVTIETRGGLFANPQRIVRDTAREVERTLAAAGAKIVRTRLDSVLRNPTGRYERSIGITTDSRGATFTDGGVIYGPWLEGTSSRNQSTRFKGYASFRRAKQQLERTIPTIIRPEIDRLTRRLD